MLAQIEAGLGEQCWTQSILDFFLAHIKKKYNELIYLR